MSLNQLCPCFKLKNRILIDPIRLYTELLAADPEPQPVSEPKLEPVPEIEEGPQEDNDGQNQEVVGFYFF